MNYFFFWPGARGIFRFGRWSFLAIAMTFSILTCAILLVHFHWTEVFSREVQKLSWFVYFISWVALATKASRLEKRILKNECPPASEKDILHDAQLHYLQGNWFETECCLNMLLKRNPRDVNAMLMLATLYRHNKRLEEAVPMVKNLDLLEESALWKFEIRAEKKKLRQALSQKKPQPSGQKTVAQEPQSVAAE